MVCPRCDDQGLIYNANVSDLSIILNICDECEACWPKDEAVTIESFKDLTVFLEENGLTYNDSKIINLGYLSPNEDLRQSTFFNGSRNEIIALIDEAWLNRNSTVKNDSGAYLINMNKIVGTEGETAVKIIVKPGTAEIITAYPVKIEKHT